MGNMSSLGMCLIILMITLNSARSLDESRFSSDVLEKTVTLKSDCETNFTKWMSNDAFQEYFNQKFESGFFPVILEGKLVSESEKNHVKGDWEYRGIFVKKPSSSFFFYAYWGTQDERFQQLDQKLSKGGYEKLISQNFQDVIDQKIYQTVWFRSDQIPQAKKDYL